MRRFSCIDRFAVKLCCEPRGEGLTAELHYDAGRFAGEDITRMAGSFHALLESAARRPESAVGELGMVSRAEFLRLYGPREAGVLVPGWAAGCIVSSSAKPRGGRGSGRSSVVGSACATGS